MNRADRRSKQKDQNWDLSDATECRSFLKSLRIGPKKAKIEFGYNANGDKVTLDEMSDEQILGLVRQLFGTQLDTQ